MLENNPPSSSLPKNANAILKIIKTKKQTIVAIFAYLPIFWDNFSSFSSRYVFYSSSFKSPFFLYLASMVLSPTAQTIALPYPAITLESANKNGSGLFLWLSTPFFKEDSSLFIFSSPGKYML